MSNAPEDRLRPPPEARFAARAEVVDLDAATEHLQREAGGGQHGHRQVALFHQGPVTVALYTFDAGAGLPDHVVDGAVLIHVLDGRLRVSAEGEEHQLNAGKLLRLAPGVRHDVTADAASRMLLHVHLAGPESHVSA